ncbi:MAG: hypothetical protein QM733_10355 [Ilumatobacteraceae bacterium]
MVAADQRTLPLLDALAALVPAGRVQRGSTVGCTGPASMSLAMAVAAGPLCSGSWAAVAGVPAFGVRAAAELGVPAGRLVLVTEPPGGMDGGRWADAVAAMIDGFDVVVLGPRLRIRPPIARRLQSRAQSRGAVLVTVGVLDGFGCDVQLVATRQIWSGLGDGHGVATARRVDVELRGRRVPRPQRAVLWLPDAAGIVRAETGEALVTRLEQTG